MRAALVLALLTACGGDDPPPEPAAGCNPLVGDDCLSPFPSSFVEVADPTTATGFRVAIDDATLPTPRHGPALTAARLNRHDGISASTPFVVYFAAGVAAADLATGVQVIDLATGARLPVLAELDANAFEGERQSLIIHPLVHLSPSTHYAIALVGLHDATGAPLAPAPFAALRDGKPLNQALTAIAPHYEDLFTQLATAGIARSSLTLAWDLTTASDADATAHLVAMRDTALAMVPQLTWTITSRTDGTGDRLRELVGTFQTPSFLVDDSLSSVMNEDATGTPVLRGLGTANFVVEIPACAKTATAPLPVMVYGHGLFGTAKDELHGAYHEQLAQDLCMIQIGTDWIGLANYDFTTLANDVLPDFNNIHIVTDRLQQAHVNAQVLVRLVLARMKDDPALAVDGHPITDGHEVYYFGISNGGIQGATFMALSPDITRGALNVPGCEWSLLMFRSNDFASLQTILGSVLPDKVDQEILLALIQPEFDFSDPASFAAHLLHDPLAGATTKRILVQESENDAEVTNLSTRVLARTIGLPGLDLVHPVDGITEAPGPLSSAYTQFDITPTPLPPAGNIPPDDDNGAHDTMHKLAVVQQQLKTFLSPTGQVEQVCTGPCVCDFAGGTCVFP